MPITATHYTSAIDELLLKPFAAEGNEYGAILVSNAYIFDAAHSTFADIAGKTVGATIKLSGKSVTYTNNFTFLKCNDLDFVTANGSVDAAYCVIFTINGGTVANTDKLIFCIDFNSGAMETVNKAIELSNCGLIGFKRSA